MFAPIPAHPLICEGWQPMDKLCTPRDTSDLPCNDNATQVISLNHALKSRPPTRHSIKNNSCWHRLAKCINALCQHLHAEGPWESLFLAQIRPILASFSRFMGPKSLENCAVHPPNPDKDASKSPKNGFWGHFGPFGGHFYPFYIDF